MCSVTMETGGWVRGIMGWQTVGHPQPMLSVVLHQSLTTSGSINYTVGIHNYGYVTHGLHP